MKLVPVILSGGAGTRLWPLSRELLPKQLLALTGERTMIQDTAARLAGFPDATAPMVVCNEAHRFLVAEQLREMGMPPAGILLEPVGRNTAPAIALAAHAARQLAGDDATHAGAAGGSRAARSRGIPGIDPAGDSRRRGRQAGRVRHRRAHARDRLRLHPPRRGQRVRSRPSHSSSKNPNEARAREFIASGDYFWNSGMFMFGAARFLDELAAHAPDIAEVCARASATAVREKDFTRVDEAVFAACRSDSVDYAVMEKTRDAVMVPLDAGWNDVGSWAALHEVLPADERGNVIRGDVLLEDADGCYVHADSRLVAALGLA